MFPKTNVLIKKKWTRFILNSSPFLTSSQEFPPHLSSHGLPKSWAPCNPHLSMNSLGLSCGRWSQSFLPLTLLQHVWIERRLSCTCHVKMVGSICTECSVERSYEKAWGKEGWDQVASRVISKKRRGCQTSHMPVKPSLGRYLNPQVFILGTLLVMLSSPLSAYTNVTFPRFGSHIQLLWWNPGKTLRILYFTNILYHTTYYKFSKSNLASLHWA